MPCRQRRYFYYLTGCNLADCHFAYDIASSRSILFIPPIDPDDVIWSGLPVSVDDALRLYDVDEVKYTDDVNPPHHTHAFFLRSPLIRHSLPPVA